MSVAGVAALAALFETGSRHRRFALRWQIARDDADRHRRRVEADYSERLHEARSTVMAIEGGVRSMAPETTEGEAHTHDLLRALTAEVGRLRGLLEQRESVEGPKPFDVREAIEPTLALHIAAGQDITADLPDRLTAIGRAEGVAQVVAGLLVNASKHAPGPVDVAAVRDGAFVTVRVADRGPGIPRADRERVFELGERGASPAPGQGIGLHVARRIMRSMDGDLWAEPRVGGGAVFVLCFPTPPELTVLPGGQTARRSRRHGRPDQAVER
jgi:signal transduction histidine kinase